jgi:hypothetical protein
VKPELRQVVRVWTSASKAPSRLRQAPEATTPAPHKQNAPAHNVHLEIYRSANDLQSGAFHATESLEEGNAAPPPCHNLRWCAPAGMSQGLALRERGGHPHSGPCSFLMLDLPAHPATGGAAPVGVAQPGPDLLFFFGWFSWLPPQAGGVCVCRQVAFDTPAG